MPVVSLHFYMVFPRVNPFYRAHRRSVVAALYGIPSAFAMAIWWCMASGGWLRGSVGPAVEDALSTVLWWIKGLSIGYIGLSVVGPGALHRLPEGELPVGGKSSRTEPDLLDSPASWLAILPIGYLLWGAYWEPARLGPEQRGVADVPGLADLHDGVRAQHHSLQTLAG